MAIFFPSLFLFLSLFPFPSSSTTYTSLNQGSSLSSPADVLISSPNAIFTAGFFPVGENAYCFAIWFTDASPNRTPTVVWTANRDEPVNGRNTELSLLRSGDLVLRDAGQLLVWSSRTDSASVLLLRDNGNLVLRNKYNNASVWQSFDSPTDTLLPQQPLTRNANLISSRSSTNLSSGFYKLYFDSDNVLRILYEGSEVRSVFWPAPWLNIWDVGRTTYNTSKIAVLDLHGKFVSTDHFQFRTSDAGTGPRRRMTMDPDGILRVYSLNRDKQYWEVTWQHDVEPCRVHGICGANSLCTYRPDTGRSCSCLPGYKVKNLLDWSGGCVPDFNKISCNNHSHDKESFLQITHTEYYGFDLGYFINRTLKECESLCLEYCDCRGFQYKFDWNSGVYTCYPKTLLFSGYQSLGFQDGVYIRLPKHMISKSNYKKMSDLECRGSIVDVERAYQEKHERSWWKSMAWLAGVLGAMEVICLLIFLYKTKTDISSNQDNFQILEGFRRFTYEELKKASRNFSEEIGRGGSGVVYKGVLSDNRVAAIKRLNEAHEQGEAEFMAEVGTIGSLNHANLIERWGYCAEGKHRMLVYEFLEKGSLEQNLECNGLDFDRRFEIALGVAKGLAYLHEECLEWVLHCDVKPQNILLDAEYRAKVADFGLSKQVKRSGRAEDLLNVSVIRGTRGYMAPEWVLNLPITSKVDVYSYGVVVLEMVTGKGPKELGVEGGYREMDEGSASPPSSSSSSWVEKMADPRLGGEYDVGKLEKLVRVALECVRERRDARPTMTQVVDVLVGSSY